MEIVLESGWEEQIVVQYSVVLTRRSHAGMQKGVGRNSLSHSKDGNGQRESVCARGRVFVLVHEYRHPGLLIEKVAVSGWVETAVTSWRLEVGGKVWCALDTH